MKKTNEMWMGLTVLVAAASVPLLVQAQEEAAAVDSSSYRNLGPYIGAGVGYNQAEDQTYKFRGTATQLVTQPTVPIELPTEVNTGDAAEVEYKGNVYYTGVLGYKFANGFRPEFEVSYRQNEADEVTELGTRGRASPTDQVKITSTTGMFNLWYDLFPSWKIHPYLGGGVGVSRLKIHKLPTNQLSEGDRVVSTPGTTTPGPPVCLAQDCSGPRKADDATLMFQGGAGLRWDWSDTLTIGLDYRYLKGTEGEYYGFKDQQETHLDAEYEAHSVMLSANYFFALPAPPPPPPAPETVAVIPAPAPCSDAQDNDGDGLVDFPADPGCTSADDGDETDPAQCSDGKDNDGDGLIDFPADKGCTAAEDNDETDPCKKPVEGEVISLKGCGTGDIIVLRGVNFEFDKARLTANAKAILDGVAGELTQYSEITIELGGHTDAKGSDEYNQALSERRAAAVVKYLASQGVEESRMSAVGYGEAQPVADNETDEGRELNRRVELKVLSGVAGAPGAGADAPALVPADSSAATPEEAAAESTAPAGETVDQSLGGFETP